MSEDKRSVRAVDGQFFHRSHRPDTVDPMEKSFEQLSASLLYCNKCGQAMPVRERLLLVLPHGDLYDYTCQRCGSSVGSRTVKSEPEMPRGVPRIVRGL